MIDLSNFDTGNVTNMSYMFYNCSKLTTLDVSNWNTSKVTYMNYMFQSCSSLTTIDVSKWDTSKVTDMSSMFYGCSKLTTLDLSNWNTNNVTGMSSMFQNCSSLTTIDVSNWNTSNVTTMYRMFSGCSSLTTLDLSNFDSKLTTIDVSKWDTSKVTDMSYMFEGCSSLTTLDVSNWNTSNVTDMYYMFYGCSSLTTLDVRDWNTSNVTNMGYMFYNCSKLTTLDVSDWNTSNVIGMSYMFLNCSKLTKLDVSSWNTGNVTNMSSMFQECSSLTELNLSNFNTSKVTNMKRMFFQCDRLSKLVLCNWDTSNVTSMEAIFFRTGNLQVIYVGPNWTTKNLTDTTNIFLGSGVSSVTQSDNCEVDAMSLSLTSLSDNNSISLIANADTNVMNYSFSNDNGETWVNSNSNVYTFDNLNVNSIYNTQIRANLSNGQSKIVSKVITTSSLEKPSFKENGNIVTITYPEGCGNGLTCTYQKDNGSIVNVTSNSVNVNFIDSGSLVATVSDGNNTVSSSYTVTVLQKVGGQEVEIVTTGDGLYADEYENGKYTYKGTNPNNYITFNNEMWRIISIDSNGLIKIMRNESIGNRAFYSGDNNAWETSDIKTYLNDTYLPTITANQDKIVPHTWSIGKVTFGNRNLAGQINDENENQSQSASIGMITVSEYLRANTNIEQCGNFSLNDNQPLTCKTTNWMYNIVPSDGFLWTISSKTDPFGSNNLGTTVSGNGSFSSTTVNYRAGVSPALYLISSTKLLGTGTQTDPYKIVN